MRSLNKGIHQMAGSTAVWWTNLDGAAGDAWRSATDTTY